MSRMATVFAIIILSLAFDACIDPYTKETPANPNILTVNGMITTEYGPHEISLTYANQFSNTSDGNRVPIREAKVTIEDDLGREVVLEEALFETTRRIVVGNRVLSEPSFLPTGRYQTPADFRAEVGRTYTLRITTATNERYSSLPEKLLKTPNLDSIEIGFYNTPSINPLIENKGVELIAHFTDPPDERNFYFWNLTNGHMALIAEPHLNQAHLRGGGQPITCCEICYMEELRLTKNFTITVILPKIRTTC